MPRATGRKRNTRSTPYEKKGRAGMTWTHKFLCLGQTAVESVPNPQDKYTLKQANLGEKKLVFKLNGDYVQVILGPYWIRLVALSYTEQTAHTPGN